MRKLPDLANAVQLASEAPDSRDVLMFESARAPQKPLPDLPNAVQLASEVPDTKSTIFIFAAHK